VLKKPPLDAPALVLPAHSEQRPEAAGGYSTNVFGGAGFDEWRRQLAEAEPRRSAMKPLRVSMRGAEGARRRPGCSKARSCRVDGWKCSSARGGGADCPPVMWHSPHTDKVGGGVMRGAVCMPTAKPGRKSQVRSRGGGGAQVGGRSEGQNPPNRSRPGGAF
jgi:hypothetical protein